MASCIGLDRSKWIWRGEYREPDHVRFVVGYGNIGRKGEPTILCKDHSNPWRRKFPLICCKRPMRFEIYWGMQILLQRKGGYMWSIHIDCLSVQSCDPLRRAPSWRSSWRAFCAWILYARGRSRRPCEGKRRIGSLLHEPELRVRLWKDTATMERCKGGLRVVMLRSMVESTNENSLECIFISGSRDV